MGTIQLDAVDMSDLQPAHALWQTYTPEHASYRFKAQNHSEAKSWRQRTRQGLARTIGFQDIPKEPLAPGPGAGFGVKSTLLVSERGHQSPIDSVLSLGGFEPIVMR